MNPKNSTLKNTEQVILVDENDKEIGVQEKLEAHQKGSLHRAISVFIFNSKGEMLLQQRAFTKYHSGGLWTNTCCSHPMPGESSVNAATRRLEEEMGMKEVELDFAFSFLYKVKLDNELTEHELDHVFVGQSDDAPTINAEEACAWRYISLEELAQQIAKAPQEFTYWFKLIFNRVRAFFLEKKLKSSPEQVITLENHYNAPLRLVWEVITQRAHLKEWYFNFAEDWKLNAGAVFEWTAGEPGGVQWLHRGEMLEIVENKKLLHTWEYPGYSGTSIVSWNLYKVNENTTAISFSHFFKEPFDQKEEALRKENFVEGWTHILNVSLAGYLNKSTETV